MDKFGDYSELYQLLIRPRRRQYTMHDLGASEFMIGHTRVTRHDVTLKNRRNCTLYASVFNPNNHGQPPANTILIYCHGNGGCRLDAYALFEHLLPWNIAIFAFDFAGCGWSEGEFITLGCNEKYDVQSVIGYLRHTFPGYKNILLWGRSMGAATTILYLGQNPMPDVLCAVADSPFANLKDVAHTFGGETAKILPSFIMSTAITLIRFQIEQKVGVDIFDTPPVEVAGNIKIPVMIGVGKSDELTQPRQAMQIFERLSKAHWASKFQLFEGTHYSPRTDEFLKPAVNFLLQQVRSDTFLPSGLGHSSTGHTSTLYHRDNRHQEPASARLPSTSRGKISQQEPIFPRKDYRPQHTINEHDYSSLGKSTATAPPHYNHSPQTTSPPSAGKPPIPGRPYLQIPSSLTSPNKSMASPYSSVATPLETPSKPTQMMQEQTTSPIPIINLNLVQETQSPMLPKTETNTGSAPIRRKLSEDVVSPKKSKELMKQESSFAAWGVKADAPKKVLSYHKEAIFNVAEGGRSGPPSRKDSFELTHSTATQETEYAKTARKMMNTSSSEASLRTMSSFYRDRSVIAPGQACNPSQFASASTYRKKRSGIFAK